MDDLYINEYINYLERVISYAHHEKYFLGAVENMISYCSFFQKIEKTQRGFAPIIEETKIIQDIFPDDKISIEEVPVYNQCLWVAESYIRLQSETGLTFEAIFLYIPLQKMFELFPLYHEMDFSQIILLFKNLLSEKSIFEILLEKYNYTLKYISFKTKVSYDYLYSLKRRRRDIKKASVELVVQLADEFNVRIETIAELKM